MKGWLLDVDLLCALVWESLERHDEGLLKQTWAKGVAENPLAK